MAQDVDVTTAIFNAQLGADIGNADIPATIFYVQQQPSWHTHINIDIGVVVGAEYGKADVVVYFGINDQAVTATLMHQVHGFQTSACAGTGTGAYTDLIIF